MNNATNNNDPVPPLSGEVRRGPNDSTNDNDPVPPLSGEARRGPNESANNNDPVPPLSGEARRGPNESTNDNAPFSGEVRRGLGLVVAASTNNAIGKNNQLLWHLPNDLKFFKNTTWGFPVIMGRKTFEAVNKPLPGRTNIVITRKPDWQAEGAITALDLEDAVKKAAATNAKQIFVIGGGEIYRQSMAIAETIYITRVHAVLEGDTFFPVIDESIWQLVSNEDFPADEKHAYAYSFQVWKRFQ